MVRDAPVAPQRQDSIEDLQLPPENEVTFYNDNIEMTSPVDGSPCPSPLPSHHHDGTINSNDVQQFEDCENFELPKPPKVVNVAKPSDDQAAFLWFEYRTNLPKTPVLSWEIKRYKLNKDGRWTFKSSRVFQEKEADIMKKSRMVSQIHYDSLISYIHFRPYKPLH